MVNLNDVLLAMSNIPVDDPIAEIWGRGLQGGYKIIKYTGTLPITINANGDALFDYRIYGADGGVGEPTENLFDENSPSIHGAIQSDGSINPNQNATTYDYMAVEPSTVYSMKAFEYTAGDNTERIAWYDENKNFLYRDYRVIGYKTLQRTSPTNAKYCRISINNTLSKFVLIKESVMPTSYIPYGYKLPMIVNNGITNIVPPVPAETKTSNGITVTSDGKGTYTISGTATADTIYLAFNFDRSISCGRKNTVTIFNSYIMSGLGSFLFIGSSGTLIPIAVNRVWYNLDMIANKTITGISFFVPSGATVNGTISPLIFDGVNIVPTEFVPYVPPVSYDVPVYIGENQLDSVEGVADYVDKLSGKIVRMIGEYTFTGDESFNKYGNSDVFYTSKTIDPVGITTVNTITMRCNHPAFTAIENKDTRYWLNSEADDICCFLPGGMSQVFLRSTSNFTTAAECKAYLKAQYDNGTPVKISYWLKTPIEEDPPVPLSEIPTVKGETVIDYDGEPKPSSMYIKYKGEG